MGEAFQTDGNGVERKIRNEGRVCSWKRRRNARIAYRRAATGKDRRESVIYKQTVWLEVYEMVIVDGHDCRGKFQEQTKPGGHKLPGRLTSVSSRTYIIQSQYLAYGVSLHDRHGKDCVMSSFWCFVCHQNIQLFIFIVDWLARARQRVELLS